MANRIKRKIDAGQAERKANFVARMPSGQQCHEPGSQNRKKVYGKRSKQR